MDGRNATAPVNVVVIGGGVAGTTCAAELAALAREGYIKVTLIDPQSVVKASSIVAKVTRAAFDVNVSESVASKWCQDHGISFVQDRAVRIENQEVHCATGATFPFFACCIATGARPYLPPALRAKEFSDRVVTIRDTDSVESLKRKLSAARRIIVVGGGGIAMEVVHEITGCELIWLMKGTHIGSAFFDKRGGECLSQLSGLDSYLRNHGDIDRYPYSPIAQSNGNRHIIIKPGLPAETSTNQVRSRQSTDGDRFGSGVGPEWIARRFEPVLYDKKGNVQTRARIMYTELRGSSNAATWKRAQIVLESEIRQLAEDETAIWPVIAVLSNGSIVGCDLILAGTGVVPNVEWLQGSGIDTDCDRPSAPTPSSDTAGGVLVSADDLCTNVRGVFAAGDCTTVKPGTGGTNWFQMRLWSQAQTAGHACAQSMTAFLRGEVPACAGLDFEVFAHATQFFNKKVVLLGRYNAQGLQGEYKMLESGGEKGDEYYVRAVVQGGRVRGALLIGEVDKAESFENLILNGLDVSGFGAELVDPSFDMEDYFD